MSTDGPDPVDLYVGARVRAVRRGRGVTQIKLAASIGLSWQQVQKYEVGQNRVSASVLVHIAEVLEVPPVDLLPASRRKAASDLPNAMLAARADTAWLARAWSRLSPDVRRVVRALIQRHLRDLGGRG
jgi:transcriptional regulator with XRE-family HTH domain